MKFLILFISMFGLALFQECETRKSDNRGEMSNSEVRASSNNLEVRFKVERATIKTADDFLATAVFTNRGSQRMRLNTMFLGFAPILLKIQHHDGTPVDPTSPPFPPEDDGEEGRVFLMPNESVSFQYRGVDLFGNVLADGRYQVRFRHENTVTAYRDWVGTIETDWVSFDVDSSNDAVPETSLESPPAAEPDA